jgi:sterol desaturase/sphingolipid hydroxylase (fatty acid hydroxylase superfamily)
MKPTILLVMVAIGMCATLAWCGPAGTPLIEIQVVSKVASTVQDNIALVQKVAAYIDGLGATYTAFIASIVCLAVFMKLMSEKSPVPHAKKDQWFGDSMANEGEINEIWKSTGGSYAALMVTASTASLVTGCSIFTLPAYYCVGMVAFYGWHVLAHTPSSCMNKAHRLHHYKEYNTGDFYGDKSGAIQRTYGKPPTRLVDLLSPRASTTMDLNHEGPLLAAMALVLATGAALGTSLATLGFVLAGYMTMALVGCAIHMSFHVRDFELEPFAWYRQLRALHLVHHSHHKNFAMVNMHADRLGGTLATKMIPRKVVKGQ